MKKDWFEQTGKTIVIFSFYMDKKSPHHTFKKPFLYFQTHKNVSKTYFEHIYGVSIIIYFLPFK